MDETIGDLLAHPKACVREPATEEEIMLVSELLDSKLPHDVLRLWSASNGVDFESLHCHMPGTAEVTQLIEEKVWCDFAAAGWLPILDDHESNYLAICVRSPLAFRVVHVPHDDGPRLLYRNLGSALRDFLDHANQEESPDLYLFESSGDYAADAPRTEDDRATAKALLAGQHVHSEWNYAAKLLDAADLPEWQQLLETDHFVRRDVLMRMRRMTDPAIKQLLRQDQKSFDDFVALAAREAHRVGLTVGERREDCLQIGTKWMSMEAFFHRRGIPNAIPRMLDWFRDLLDERNPHDRKGHFMED